MVSSVTVGVFGHYGQRNLGDEAITAAVIENVRARFPDACVIGLSMDPEDTGQRYGIPAFPIRYAPKRKSAPPWVAPVVEQQEQPPLPVGKDGRSWHELAVRPLKRVPALRAVARIGRRVLAVAALLPKEIWFLGRAFKVVRRLDLLVIAGSNQLLDNFGGPWGYPYTLYKWTALAKLAGVRIAVMSVGAGPLSAPLSKWIVRRVLAMADYRSYRDIGSLRLIESLGFRQPGRVTADLAFSLNVSRTSPRHVAAALRIAVNPMPVHDARFWPEADPAKYRAYVGKLAAFVREMIEQGHRVELFPTQTMDELTIADVLAALAVRHERLTVRRLGTLDDLLRELSAVDVVVATRFHGVILALCIGKPVIAISYYRKTSELMQVAGQDEFVVDLDEFRQGDLECRIETLRASMPGTVARIAAITDQYRSALQGQYDEIFALLPRA